MPAPKSDPQRDSVYYLEAEINGAWEFDRCSQKELNAAAWIVCRYFKVPAPKIKVYTHKGRNADAGMYDDGVIELNRGKAGCNFQVLLHELAHYIVDQFYEDGTYEHHGPEFVAIYMHLLDKYSVLPHECFRLLAKKHRIKIGRRFRPKAFK